MAGKPRSHPAVCGYTQIAYFSYTHTMAFSVTKLLSEFEVLFYGTFLRQEPKSYLQNAYVTETKLLVLHYTWHQFFHKSASSHHSPVSSYSPTARCPHVSSYSPKAPYGWGNGWGNLLHFKVLWYLCTYFTYLGYLSHHDTLHQGPWHLP